MVRLQLTVHKFFCLNQECQQKIFTERQLPIPSSTSLARAVVLLSSRRIDQDERSDSSFITALQTSPSFPGKFSPLVGTPVVKDPTGDIGHWGMAGKRQKGNGRVLETSYER